MRQIPLGRPTARFVPLPVDLDPKPHLKQIGTPSSLREVPFVPTPQHVVDEMLHVARVTERDILYDLGCGDGRIVISAAKSYGAKGLGVDLDPDRISESKTNAIAANVQDKVQFLQQSFFDVDFSPATVVSIYLLPWVNAILRPKLLTQLKPGSRIVSHAFSMHDWQADRTVKLPNSRIIYVWTVPAPIAGSWSAAIRLPDGHTHHAKLEFEQELQTIIGNAHFDDDILPLDPCTIRGDRLTFTLRSPVKPREKITYTCHVEADTLRGTAHGTLEIRARRSHATPPQHDA
jgi:SAM-dependent methyltransferase